MATTETKTFSEWLHELENLLATKNYHNTHNIVCGGRTYPLEELVDSYENGDSVEQGYQKLKAYYKAKKEKKNN